MANDAAKLVHPFYDALNRPGIKDVRGLVLSCTMADWRSYSGESTSKSREEFIQQVIGFGKLIPDLAWTIKEILSDGDKVIVRSEATGTPTGDFFGVPHGGKSFSIMTIDIHTTSGGKLAVAHHVEDWAAAVRQLSSR
jgi:predicted ester cyclase